jgi:hypothetical protein
MCVLFPHTRIEWDMHYSCQILINFEYTQQTFVKIPKYQFYWKSDKWQLNCSMQTERCEEANSCFLQMCLKTENTGMNARS